MKRFRVLFGIGSVLVLLIATALTVFAEGSAATKPQSSPNLVTTILSGVLVLFLILGYFPGIKKYLPTTIYYRDEQSYIHKCLPYRHLSTWLSVLLPFVPVTATVEIHFETVSHSVHGAKIPNSTAMRIRARNKNSAFLINAVELYKSDGIWVDTAAPLAIGVAVDNHAHPPRIVLSYVDSMLEKDGAVVVTFCDKP